MKTKLLLISALIMAGCAATPEQPPKGPVYLPNVKLHDGDYRETWHATLAAIKTLPLKRADKDSGLIDTDWVPQASESYFNMFGGEKIPKEARVKFHIHIVEKFKSPQTRVSITKYEQITGTLPGDWVYVPTSGHIEKILHYRIKRQIELNRKLRSSGLAPLPLEIPKLEGLE